MDTDTDQVGGVTPLTTVECLQRLARAGTGRLGFHANALPMLLPVDFALHDGEVVIRVRAGSQLDAATRDAVVAFQADGEEPGEDARWSVSVTGVARHVVDPSERAALRSLPLDDGGGRDDDRFVRVSLDVLAGRRSAS